LSSAGTGCIEIPAEFVFGTAMSTPSKPRQPLDDSPIHPPVDSPFRSPLRPQSLKGVRLRKHADYQRAYAASRKRQSASMSWFLALRQAEEGPSAIQPQPPRVGLTAGKVLGKAHERNRIKRRMREALRRHIDLLPPDCDLILHPRRSVLMVEFAKLESEIVRILQQAKAEAARMNLNPGSNASSAHPQ
jgi:ribonuclease P protein component